MAVNDPSPEPALPRSAGPALVLVIDDEQAVRAATQVMLESAGFEVLAAGDGAQGIELLRREGERVALVLLDMAMPRMDGVETLAQLRRLQPDVPVLLSSGYGENEARERLRGARSIGFLQKPYRAAALVAKLRELLSASA